MAHESLRLAADASLTRRRLMKGAMIAGTVAWVTPVVQVLSVSESAAQTTSGATNTPNPPGQTTGNPAEVRGVSIVRGDVSVPPPLTQAGGIGGQDELPRTGNESAKTAAVGAALLAFGGVVRAASRVGADDPEAPADGEDAAPAEDLAQTATDLDT